MATKGKRPMRALTPSDKIEAIQRVNDGESKASVARDIGVPESTLRGWCKNEDKLRYMTSRLSSPDTDKSNDGEPADKRARTESPVAPQSPAAAGLDLSAPAGPAHAAHQAPPPHGDAPVELTTKRTEPATQHAAPRERRPDPGASVSMSAISPLSGLAHLPSLTHSHLGLSFNEIATNLTLLAQLNPGLSGLSAQPASRALRSVRSPKPAHNGVLNLNESKHRSKSHHSSDPYHRHGGHGGSKSSHHGGSQSAGQPVDDTLWYWLKTQQAMLDLTAQTTTAHTLQLGKPSEPSLPPKPVAPAPPISSHLDYNRNSWLWQYYKQFGGAVPLPEDKLKSASQVPKDKTAENILYSQLTKGKTEEEHAVPTSPVHAQLQPHSSEIREPVPEPRLAEPRLPEPRVPEPRMPEPRVPEHRSPEHRLPEHRLPEPRMPEHRVPEPRVPEPRVPEPRVPESRVPEPRVLESRVPEPVASPDVGAESKESTPDKNVEAGRSQTKARIVLDNLLFNNTSQVAGEEAKPSEVANGEWESGTAEALEHGEKFLRWLESSGDPSVTRMHVHQLSALLHNLRTRRAHQHAHQHQLAQPPPAAPAAPAAAEPAPRRK